MKLASISNALGEFLSNLLAEAPAVLENLSPEETEDRDIEQLSKSLKSPNSGAINDVALRGTLYRLLTPAVSPASLERTGELLADWAINEETPLENVKHMSQILQQVHHNVEHSYGSVPAKTTQLKTTIGNIAALRLKQSRVIHIPEPSAV